MKLIFAVLDVSLTMGRTCCYKTEGFFYIYYLYRHLYMFTAFFSVDICILLASVQTSIKYMLKQKNVCITMFLCVKTVSSKVVRHLLA